MIIQAFLRLTDIIQHIGGDEAEDKKYSIKLVALAVAPGDLIGKGAVFAVFPGPLPVGAGGIFSLCLKRRECSSELLS